MMAATSRREVRPDERSHGHGRSSPSRPDGPAAGWVPGVAGAVRRRQDRRRRPARRRPRAGGAARLRPRCRPARPVSAPPHAGVARRLQRSRARRLRAHPARRHARERPRGIHARSRPHVDGDPLRTLRGPARDRPHRRLRGNAALRPAVLLLAVRPTRAGRPIQPGDGQPHRRHQGRRDRQLRLPAIRHHRRRRWCRRRTPRPSARIRAGRDRDRVRPPPRRRRGRAHVEGPRTRRPPDLRGRRLLRGGARGRRRLPAVDGAPRLERRRRHPPPQQHP